MYNIFQTLQLGLFDRFQIINTLVNLSTRFCLIYIQTQLIIDTPVFNQIQLVLAKLQTQVDHEKSE